MLLGKGMDEDGVEQLLSDIAYHHGEADLNTADRAMLDYATTLTRRPASVTETDIAALRREGFDDRAIHEICAVTAYFAFVNRMADGLGVELEEDERFPVRGL
ncbi:MAG: peroxidase [Fidelibacterota bacterium]|nr:MAG: peroxidase [Candidatus Neomarinimicrobiota bacterium]